METIFEAGRVQDAPSYEGDVYVTFTIGNITGLQAALDGKAALAHSHTIADVTGLQTALDAKVAKAGDTISGQLISTATGADGIKLKPASVGGVGLNSGSATLPGYLSFISAAGVRQGYMGWGDAGGNRIHMAVEGSMIGHHFSGDIWSNGNIYLSTGATSYISTDGNINGTAYGGFLTTYIENRAAAYANDRAQSWAYVQNALAACGAGNIGSYVFARTPSEIGPGSGIAGTSLHWSSNTAISPGLINAGSWRCMGYAFGSQATLFLRYA